jgi:outer membrane immunogenic protein
MNRVAVAVLAGAAAVAGVGQSASAAPQAPVLASWTGFYVGVHGGAAWQSTPPWAFADPNNQVIPFSITAGGSSALGGVGGIQGGYNWQFAPMWVAGLESDISWASLSDHRTVGPLTGVVGVVAPGSSLSMTANTEWLSSVRGKIGFTGWFNNTMLYITGGAAWASIEYSAQATLLPSGSLFGPFTSTSITSFSTIKSGWVLGGGAEWMATTNILLRAEYLYYNINNAAAGSAVFSQPVAALPLAFNYSWSSYNVQVFRIAGSYKF